MCIGESLAAAEKSRELANCHPGFLAFTAGIHPHDAGAFDDVADPERLEQLVGDGASAIGECGLDYHYDHSPRDRQRRAFEVQLALAARLGKPVVVHTREANDDTDAMIRDAAAMGVRGVLHCFTGPVELAETALAADWFVSFSGIVTFKRWTDDALLRAVPSERLLIESDAPYLAPVPHRGHRNEPGWASFTVARIAAARGIDAATLGATTAANARTLFGLAPRAGVPIESGDQ